MSEKSLLDLIKKCCPLFFLVENVLLSLKCILLRETGTNREKGINLVFGKFCWNDQTRCDLDQAFRQKTLQFAIMKG